MNKTVQFSYLLQLNIQKMHILLQQIAELYLAVLVNVAPIPDSNFLFMSEADKFVICCPNIYRRLLLLLFLV